MDILHILNFFERNRFFLILPPCSCCPEGCFSSIEPVEPIKKNILKVAIGKRYVFQQQIHYPFSYVSQSVEAG